jgi:hypothetical protein
LALTLECFNHVTFNHGTYDMRATFESLLGALEYRVFPNGRAWWSGPLNGQVKRRELVEALISRFSINTVVETGTYYGASAEYFSKVLNLKTITIENSARFAGFSSAKFRNVKNLELISAHSHEALPKIISTFGQGDRVLFYLDAHCDDNDTHPLPRELEIVFGLVSKPIVLIDDFAVPFDPGYHYDIYKSGLRLNLDFISRQIVKLNPCVFFPSSPSSAESGPRRGCVVLCRDQDATAIESMPLMRRWQVATA